MSQDKSVIKVVSATLLAVLIGIGASSIFATGVVAIGREVVPLVASVGAKGTVNYSKTANLVVGVLKSNSSKHYSLVQSAPPLPELDASSYLVTDLQTGDIILERFSSEPRAIASITKLVTALTLIDSGNTESSLMYPLLLESNNRVAEEIASMSPNRANFLNNMNEYVRRLGMKNTHFSDPSGLSIGNSSTAEDLAILSKHLYNDKTELLELTLLSNKEGIASNNYFATSHAPGYLGGKSGYIPEAGGTLIAMFNVELREGGRRPIAIIILGSGSDQRIKYEVAESLRDYVKSYVTYQ